MPTLPKCHVKELSDVYTHLFRDACDAYPVLADDLQIDCSRLLRAVDHRGIHFYMVDLPNLGKHFDKCLSRGEYVPAELPFGKRCSAKVPIPRFIRSLVLLVFDSTGCLRPDADQEAVFFCRQIYYLAKKSTVECSEEAVENEFIDFYRTDLELPEPEELWDRDDVTIADVSDCYRGFPLNRAFIERLEHLSPNWTEAQVSETLRCLAMLDKVSSFVTTTLGSYDPGEWRFRHGPGAISQAVGPTDKYRWFNWSPALEREYPIADYGYHSYSSWATGCSESYVTGVNPSSRLIAVPKTLTKPRLIAAEPSEHQWCQQNVWHFFDQRAKVSWISDFVRFRDQRLNQELCTRGSLDGSLCTVDLSAASDRVTCQAVGELFRANPRLVLCLQATRTRWISQERFPNLSPYHKLRKFSTMGSACTFPVESLMFLSIALSACLVSRKMRFTPENVRSFTGHVAVFGDDIIIPKESRDLLYRILEVLYFKVNTQKSFSEGNFRESCGVDAFRGCNVTPVYWRAPVGKSAESIASAIEVSNNFYQKFLVRTANCVRRPLIRRKIPYVSFDSEVVGLKSRIRVSRLHYKCRWNPAYHRMESLVPAVTAKVKRIKTNGDSVLFQFFTENPSPFYHWEGGVPQRPQPQMRLGWVPLDDLKTQ